LEELDVYNALIVFSLLNILDVVTTYNVVRRVGSVAEANPIARFLLERMGVAGLFVLKYLIMGVVVLLGYLGNALLHSIWVNNIMLSAVVAWNSYQNYKLSSRERRD